MKCFSMFFQWDLFWKLLCAKGSNLRKKLINECVDYYVWAGCTLFISGHVLQAFGMSKDFGVFQLCAVLASIGLFSLYGNAVRIVSDIENDRSIDYYLLLPTSALTVLVSSVAYYSIIGFATGIALLPLAKLILGDQLVLSHISWAAFLFFFVLINVFFSTLTIAVASLVPSMETFDVIWVRFIFPLWFLGGFQFSWKAINATVPWLSYLMLVNPITYTTEGMRAAMLGQDGYLPFWLCSTVLLMLLVVVARWSYVAFKKRLDFV